LPERKSSPELPKEDEPLPPKPDPAEQSEEQLSTQTWQDILKGQHRALMAAQGLLELYPETNGIPNDRQGFKARIDKLNKHLRATGRLATTEWVGKTTYYVALGALEDFPSK
jgi:hypothetical protein